MASKIGKSTINTFSSGMNLDVDKSLLKDNQYRYAENVRTISNDGASTGAITNIEGSAVIGNQSSYFGSNEEIIATSTVRDLGITFTKEQKPITGSLSYQYIDNTDTGTINIPYIAERDDYVEDSRYTPTPIGLTPNYLYVDRVLINNETPERVVCQFMDVVPMNINILFRIEYYDSTYDDINVLMGPDSIPYTQDPNSKTTVIDLVKTFNTGLGVLSINVISFSAKNNGIPCDENGGENWEPNPDPLTIRYKNATQYFRYESGNIDSGPNIVTEPDVVTWHFDHYPAQLASIINILNISKGSSNTINIQLDTHPVLNDVLINVLFTSTSGKYNGTKRLVKVDDNNFYFTGIFTDIYKTRNVQIQGFSNNYSSGTKIICNNHLIPIGESRLIFIISTADEYNISITASSLDSNTLNISKPYTTNYTNTFRIYRVSFSDDKSPIFKNVLNSNGLYFGIPDGSPLSIVGRYEDSDNIKVYWADGYNFIRVANIAESNDIINSSIIDPTMFDIVPSASLKQPKIESIGSGRLNSGLIQYFYQLYSPSGGETEVSPASPMVHLIDSTIGEYSVNYLGTGLGEIYGKPSGKSVKISIEIPVTNKFIRIKLISAYYFNYSDAPVITIVKESKISDILSNGKVLMEDGGIGAIGELTQSEFNLIGGNLFIPTYIESKDNILFAANTKEDTWDIPTSEYDTRSYQFSESKEVKLFTSAGTFSTYTPSNINTIPFDHDCIHDEIYKVDRYSDLVYTFDENGSLGGSGVNVDYKFVNTYFIESYGDFYNKKTIDHNWVTVADKYIDQRTARIGDKKRNISSIRILDSSGYASDISLSDLNIPDHDGFLNYSNPYLSNNIASYQRDEIYRFACALYDTKGRKTPAKWIADIRFPAGYVESTNWDSSIFECPLELFSTSQLTDDLNNQELLVKPLGIKFSFRNIPKSVSKIEILRAKRDINNKTVYAQGAIQKVGTYELEYQPGEDGNISKSYNEGIANTLRPHSIMSMGYATSIAGPGRKQRKDHNPSIKTDLAGEYIYDWSDMDDNRYYLNNAQDRILPNYTDHALSPYFYNSSNVLFINPEVSYYGVDFTEQLRKISNSINLDLIDIIYPVSTPAVVGMGIGTPGSSYFGHIEHDRLQFYLVNDTDKKYYPSAMYFGADINNRLYVDGITTGDHKPFMSMGLVGANYKLISNISSNKQHLQNSDIPRTDIKYNTIGYFDEPADRAFIALGGIISFKGGNTYKFKNGYTYDISDNYTDDPLITIDDSNEVGISGVTFKYFNRYNTKSLSGTNSISLIHQISNSLLDISKDVYSGLNIKKSQSIGSSFSNPYFIKRVNSFEYTGNINPGLPIESVPGSSYISSGGTQYLNWAKPLTTGNGGSTPQQNTIVSVLSRTKVGGPHGDAILFNLDSSEQIPSISNIVQDRKKYHSGEYDGYKNLDRIGSVGLSTFIANIKMMNNYIYGGASEIDRQFTEYISTGAIIENAVENSDKVVFGGDTFIGIFDYTIVRATDPYVDYDSSTKVGRGSNIASQVKHIGALIPLESSINMHLVNSKSYVADNYNFAIQKEPGVYAPGAKEGSNWKHTQSTKQYDYNSAYSSERTAIGFESKLLITQDNKTFDCRVWSSEPKTNDEVYDNWAKFKIANYIDVDTQYGEITGLRKFDNKLLFWQKNAFGVLSVNERSLIKDNNISLLTLGTGGILSRFDYITNSNGMKKGMIGGIAESNTNLYWFDVDNSEMCIFNNSISILSKAKGIQSMLNLNKNNIGNNIPMIFDNKYNEMMITLYGLQGVDKIQ